VFALSITQPDGLDLLLQEINYQTARRRRKRRSKHTRRKRQDERVQII